MFLNTGPHVTMGWKFQKAASPGFYLLSIKLDDTYPSPGGHCLLNFLAICQSLKFYGTLTYFMTQPYWDCKFQNAAPTVFI